MASRRRDYIEEGLLGEQNAIRRKRKSKLVRLLFPLLAVALGIGVAHARKTYDANASAVFGRMGAEMESREWVCASSHHVGNADRNWILTRAGLRMANPLVVRAVGKAEAVIEEFTHCAGQAERRGVQRHAAVHISYEPPTFWALFYKPTLNIFVKGNDAFCVQHMLDIFKGKYPCAATNATST